MKIAEKIFNPEPFKETFKQQPGDAGNYFMHLHFRGFSYVVNRLDFDFLKCAESDVQFNKHIVGHAVYWINFMNFNGV